MRKLLSCSTRSRRSKTTRTARRYLSGETGPLSRLIPDRTIQIGIVYSLPLANIPGENKIIVTETHSSLNRTFKSIDQVLLGSRKLFVPIRLSVTGPAETYALQTRGIGEIERIARDVSVEIYVPAFEADRVFG